MPNDPRNIPARASICTSQIICLKEVCVGPKEVGVQCRFASCATSRVLSRAAPTPNEWYTGVGSWASKSPLWTLMHGEVRKYEGSSGIEHALGVQKPVTQAPTRLE